MTDWMAAGRAGRAALAAGLAVALAGCGGTGGSGVAAFSPDTDIVSRGEGPPDARPDACYARDASRAVIETVTEQREVQPAQRDASGAVTSPAVYETRTEQQIVEERAEQWFETPCAAEDDPAFIAALQRALAARGQYDGPVTSRMDRRTRAAVRAFQVPRGLDSGVLSLAAARELGLAVWDPAAAARPGATATAASAGDITGG